MAIEKAGVIPLVRQLREDLEKADHSDFPDGFVIRWQFQGRYHFAAIKAGPKWWTTGTGLTYGESRAGISYERLLEILNQLDTTAIQAAAKWVTI